MLHWGFVAVPLLAGLDKFANLMTRWSDYLAPQVASFVTSHTPLNVPQLMMVIGGVEILAALIVAIRPRIGGYIVGLWLAGIVANLLLGMHYFDIALRDVGLMVAAFALGRLGRHFDHAHKARSDEDVVVREREVAVETPARTGRFWRHRDDDMM